MTFLIGGGMVVVGGFWGKRVEAEFDLVCPGAGAAYLESILETFVWEGCLRRAPAVGFVGCCLLRSRVDICLVTAATELDMAWGGIARSLVPVKLEGQRVGGSTCSFDLRRVAVTCLVSHACSSNGTVQDGRVQPSWPSGLYFPCAR